MARPDDRRLGEPGLPGPGAAPEPVLLPAETPTPPRRWAAARGAGQRPRAESALGLGHHKHQGLKRRERPLGGHHRLRRSIRGGVAVGASAALDGAAGTGPGGGFPALRPRRGPGSRDRVPLGQWAGVRLPAPANGPPGLRDGGLPHALPESRIQRAGRGLLRQLQAGLRLPGRAGELRWSGSAASRLDAGLQRGRAAQRPRDEGARTVLSSLEAVTTHTHPCPKIGGAVQAKKQQRQG